MNQLRTWKTITATAMMGFALLTGHSTAAAQTTPLPAVGNAFLLSAFNADGARFDASSIRGNVTVAFFWATTCAVCRDSLPELRANLAGWRNKPFSLVVVSVDRQIQDWLAYERLLGKMQAPMRGYFGVHQDETGALPARLPLTLVVDAKGKVVQRIEGRVAPEVWDTVADLLN
jgi:thiol-disulfide isomerase/thioredoxin